MRIGGRGYSATCLPRHFSMSSQHSHANRVLSINGICLVALVRASLTHPGPVNRAMLALTWKLERSLPVKGRIQCYDSGQIAPLSHSSALNWLRAGLQCQVHLETVSNANCLYGGCRFGESRPRACNTMVWFVDAKSMPVKHVRFSNSRPDSRTGWAL